MRGGQLDIGPESWSQIWAEDRDGSRAEAQAVWACLWMPAWLPAGCRKPKIAASVQGYWSTVCGRPSHAGWHGCHVVEGSEENRRSENVWGSISMYVPSGGCFKYFNPSVILFPPRQNFPSLLQTRRQVLCILNTRRSPCTLGTVAAEENRQKRNQQSSGCRGNRAELREGGGEGEEAHLGTALWSQHQQVRCLLQFQVCATWLTWGLLDTGLLQAP